MAIPKFYLEKRKDKDGKPIVKDVPILMFYSFGSGRLQYYTGQRVDAKYYVERYWTKGRAPISSSAPNESNINNTLDLLANDVQDLHNKAKANRTPVTVEYLRKGLDEIHKPKPSEPKTEHDFMSYLSVVITGRLSGERLIQSGRNKGKPFKRNGVKQFGTLLSALERFNKQVRKSASLPFESIDRKFYDAFRKFIVVDENSEISTFGTHVRVFKTVMQEAKDEGIYKGEAHRANWFVMPHVESDTVAVTDEYLERIESLDLSKSKKLDNVRDLFLVGCYSALRFSDFSVLEISDVQDNFIRIRQTKTGDLVTIPVMRKMRAIIDKYNGGLPKSISNQKFNDYIKEVFEAAGLTHMVKVKNNRGGTENYEMIPYNRLISSHTARRTYATNMFKAGVPVLLIMAITGHKTEASFLRYIRATNEDKARMMAEMMEKLGL